MRKRPAWLWILLILWLAALAAIALWLMLRDDPDVPVADNRQAAQNQVSEAPIPPAKALPPAEQLTLAFRTAFGGDGEVRRSIGDNSYVYSPERIEWVGNRAMLISLGRNVDDCHACGGTMAVHYLEPVDQGLRVTGAWLEAGPSSSNGLPPGDVAINRDLTDNVIVYSTGSFIGQGYSCTVAWLVELRREGPVESGPIPISYSNEGAVLPETGRTMGGDPLRELEGRITNVRRGQSFDISFTGAERFSDTYTYQGGRFVGPELESRAAC